MTARFSFPLRPRRLTAIEVDGFGLRAAIVRAAGEGVIVEKVAASREPDTDAALDEALGELRRGGRVPRRAILVTVEVVPATLELPLDPARPRPTREMHELVRWEMEPVLAGRIASRPIGAVLIGRGYLSHEQARAVLDRLEAEEAPFGETAVEMGLVTRDQVRECLAIQAWFTGPDEAHDVGWCSQPSSPGARRTRWLAAGMNRHLGDQWRQRLARFGLSLDFLYPLVGGASALVEAPPKARLAVLEVERCFLAATRLAGGAVEGVRIAYTADRSPSAAEAIEILGGGVEALFYAGRTPGLAQLASDVARLAGVECRPIAVAFAGPLPAGTSEVSLAGIAGAARHALGRVLPHRAVAISTPRPRSSLASRGAVCAAFLLAAAAVALVLFEQRLGRDLESAEASRAEAAGRLEAVVGEVALLSRRAAEAEKAQGDVARRREALEPLRRRIEFLVTDLPARGALAPGLLAALARAAGPDVVVDAVVLDLAGELRFEAWAVSEAGAEALVRRLLPELLPWRFSIKKQSIEEKPGRLGLAGWAVALVFVRDPEGDPRDSREDR
ncbi:MAG: hypothetical protein HY720_20075 [Planctomycetes bacterium]|nr:hypothetical protein [Planctomycetota bacterium]